MRTLYYMGGPNKEFVNYYNPSDVFDDFESFLEKVKEMILPVGIAKVELQPGDGTAYKWFIVLDGNKLYIADRSNNMHVAFWGEPRYDFAASKKIWPLTFDLMQEVAVYLLLGEKANIYIHKNPLWKEVKEK